MEKYTENDPGPAAEPVSEPAAGPAAGPDMEATAEPVAEPVAEPAAEPVSEPASEPEKPEKKVKKRHPGLWIGLLALLLLLAVAAAGAGAYVLYRLDEHEAARQQADQLKAQGDYAQALDAYAMLLEDDPLSFTPFTNAYVSAGADGVVACADALLETSEGAHYLAENRVLEGALDHATHPAVPASLRSALERRALVSEAMLAEEAGDLVRALDLLEQADLRRELSYPISSTLEKQTAISDALQAREEGRYQDAIDILTESILEPELVAELQQRIVQEQDERVRSDVRAALAAMDPDAALKTLRGLSNAEDQESLRQEVEKTWAQTLMDLHQRYENRLFAGVWYTLVLGEEPLLTGDRRYADLTAASLGEGKLVGGPFSLMELKDGRVTFLGDTLGAEAAVKDITDARDAALGLNHGLVLHEDGTVTHLGAWEYGRGDAADWTGITQVAAGGFHSLGLREDGTVVAAGLDLDSQCQVSEWTDVVKVAAGLRHSVALTRDGHVLATGDDSLGQCDVSGWENIIDIRCGGSFTLGLTADWRLVAVGDDSCGQCDVSGWQEVVAFDGGLWQTMALLSDGRVLVTGANAHNLCDLSGTVLFASQRKLDEASPVKAAEGPEYVYTGHPTDGPWLYCSDEGCVIVAFDAAAGKLRPTRADLICTDGHPPVGILSGGGDKPALAVHAATLAKQNRAVFAITGDYFTFDYNADGLQIRRGQVFKEEKNELAFGFYPDGSMRLIDPNEITAQEVLDQGVRDTWVFGPTLILNGEALDIHTHPLSFNDVTMRTVVASLCPYHHIAAAYGSSTLAQVTDHLLKCGCEIAYNLDGGRSSMMIFVGKVVNRSMYINEGWRGLQDMVGFLTSDLVPAA